MTRPIGVNDVVWCKTVMGDQLRMVKGIVKEKVSIHEARRRGLVSGKRPGTVFVIAVKGKTGPTVQVAKRRAHIFTVEQAQRKGFKEE